MDSILKKYDTFIQKNQSNYFSFIAMTILVGSIWGGIAAMFIDKGNAPVWQLAINVGISMAVNVAAIGQAPLKWVMNLFIASIVVNAALMAMNF
jgi:hypothetical protein